MPPQEGKHGLTELLAPAHTALVTQEAQRGVIGDRAVLPQLADAARDSGAIANMGRLATAARAAGATVVHCVAVRRADGRGGNRNARLFAAMDKVGDALLEGTEGTEPVPEIGRHDSDILLARYHGVGPMHGTELDSVLRNLGVTTVVGVGVSLNVGMIDLTLDAVNAGYQVVIPRDAVAGVPAEYGEQVLANTLSLVATVCDTDEVIAAWS
jgi:nicotinamidase-related amidase